MGGFCLLETSDIDMTTAPSAVVIYTGSPGALSIANNTNRSMQIYRMSAADFTTFEGAWASQA